MNETVNCLCCGNSVIHKYCSPKCKHEHYRRLLGERIEEQQSGDGIDVRQVKNYLIRKHGHKCQMCGNSEWLNKPIVLILDHIDGNSSNWKLFNLRVICSNCDSTLPTYKSRNKGNGRFFRSQRYANGQSY